MTTISRIKYSITWILLLTLVPFLNSVYAQPEKLAVEDESANQFEIAKNLDIYITLFKELNTYYVEELNPAEIIQMSIKTMLKSLDPYTVFYPESDAENFRFMTTGSYGGIGAVVGKAGNYAQITQPYKDFPAQKAGLMAGDYIIAIDGKNTKNLTTDDISNLLKGQPGSKVKVTIKRDFVNIEKTVELERAKVTLENVPYYGMANDHIGYINLSAFRQKAGEDVKKAFIELKSKNDLQGIILDLRGNPGGLLIEAVKIAGLFVPRNQLIVSTKGKVKSWNKEYKTFENPVDIKIPVAILVNAHSASASEIVAGSLQDLDRAVIVGEQSFGKGLVQTTRPLSYNTQLKVTTSKYYIPSGRCIQEIDYSQKNENGKPVTVADSLITEFKTLNGRTVFNGKGIAPDIKTDKETDHEIITTLINNKVIFDFATKYRLDHDTIEVPGKFSISDDEYRNFVEFARSREIKYKTGTEKSLESLKKNAEKEHYFDKIKEDYEKIAHSIENVKNQEFELYKGQISALLENEIVSRYYFEKGRIEYGIANDPEVMKAIKVLKDKEQYQQVLQITD